MDYPSPSRIEQLGQCSTDTEVVTVKSSRNHITRYRISDAGRRRIVSMVLVVVRLLFWPFNFSKASIILFILDYLILFIFFT